MKTDQKTLLELLKKYIDYVYEHEEQFIKQFYSKYKGIWNIHEISLDDEHCRVVVIMDHGPTILESIPVNDFLDWADL